MGKNRLEAYSDGVIAILITIMVLELKVPHDVGIAGLREVAPTFAAYVMSFLFLSIYWNNHHHMLHMATHVTGGILWANTHLLFWLSLVPFATRWIGENHFTELPTAIYGFILFMPAIAYYILRTTIIKSQGKHSPLGAALGKDLKGKLSPLFYAAGIAMAFVNPMISYALYITVTLMWLIPDRRIEKAKIH